MEVHHHSHSTPATGGTPGKKWRHYFWEFVMLFLAVFCGFLAEYLLEHKIEHDREKQYMVSMLEDLKKDSGSINKTITGNKSIRRGLDTLLNLIAAARNDKTVEKDLFLYSVKYTYWFFTVEFSELTLTQLKNSGGFRLIKNKKVSEGIAAYAQGLEFSKYQFSEVVQYFHKYEETQKKVLNWELARKAYEWLNSDITNMIRPMEEMKKLIDNGQYLLPGAVAYFSQYYSEILFYISSMENLHTNFEKQKQKAIALIQLIHDRLILKTEYGSTCSHSHSKKKMDALFLGVFNAVPCCVCRISCRKPKRALYRTSTGKAIYDNNAGRSEIRYDSA